MDPVRTFVKDVKRLVVKVNICNQLHSNYCSLPCDHFRFVLELRFSVSDSYDQTQILLIHMNTSLDGDAKSLPNSTCRRVLIVHTPFLIS